MDPERACVSVDHPYFAYLSLCFALRSKVVNLLPTAEHAAFYSVPACALTCCASEGLFEKVPVDLSSAYAKCAKPHIYSVLCTCILRSLMSNVFDTSRFGCFFA